MSLQSEYKEPQTIDINHIMPDFDFLYLLLQQIKHKEMQRIKTTMTNIEQKYKDYIHSILNIKQTICDELYSNMMDKVTEINDKQLLIVVKYYENVLNQVKTEKEELFRKNKEQQNLVQQFQNQSLDISHRIASTALQTLTTTPTITPHVTQTTARNPFQTMPSFDINPCKKVDNSVSTEDEEEYESSSTTTEIDVKTATETDLENKQKLALKNAPQKQKTYKYRKHGVGDQSRIRNTDKTYLWCNHRRSKDNKCCGVKCMYELKRNKRYTQHKCDAHESQDKITRIFNHISPKCKYCDGSKPCIRLATVDEIKEYEKRQSAFETLSMVQSAFETLLPTFNQKNDEIVKIHQQKDTCSDINEDKEEDDDDYKESNIHTNNQPLKRRFRKRKLVDFSDNEPTAKKHKIDDGELKNMDIDELLSKAFQYKQNLKWDIDDEWCRYCGARGSTAFASSQWGPKTLCQKHGYMWKKNELDLTSRAEPMNRDQIIDKDACTEKGYLIKLIKKYQRFTVETDMISYRTVGKRRSLRNLRKQRVYSKPTEFMFANEENELQNNVACDHETSYLGNVQNHVVMNDMDGEDGLDMNVNIDHEHSSENEEDKVLLSLD